VALANDELSGASRITIASVIALEVQNVSTLEALIAANVTDLSAEEWTSVIRHYMENDRVKVQINGTTFEYQNEL
jgi:hypothetical protein